MQNSKNILFGSDAKKTLLAGMKLGIQNFESEDPSLDAGIAFIREFEKKMHNECKDGIALSTFFLYKMAEEAFIYPLSPIILTEALEKGVKSVLTSLQKELVPIKTDEEKFQIAKKCSNGDQKIALAILEAIEKAGPEGIIHIEEGPFLEPLLEIDHGLEIRAKPLIPHFEPKELHQATIVIMNKIVSSSFEILPILQEAILSNTPLVIAAHNIDGEALSTLTLNHFQKRLTVCPLSSDSLETIANATNGKAKKIIINEHSIFLIGPHKNIICTMKVQNKSLYQTGLDATKEALKEGLLMNGSFSFLSALTNLDRTQFSPIEESALNILETTFKTPSEFSENPLTFSVASRALNCALSTLSSLLLSEALIVESSK